MPFYSFSVVRLLSNLASDVHLRYRTFLVDVISDSLYPDNENDVIKIL